jgi:hypothetical protein
MKTYKLLLRRAVSGRYFSALKIDYKYLGTNIESDVEAFVEQRYPGWTLHEVTGPGYSDIRDMFGRKIPKSF